MSRISVSITARCYLEHGIPPSVRLSVYPSVKLVDCDRRGLNSSKIISHLNSHFLIAIWRPEHHGSTPKGTPRNFGSIGEGYIEEVHFGVQKL